MIVERMSRLAPWIVTSVLLAITFSYTAIYTRNIGIQEDWFMVGPWVGKEPDLLGWLWSQNNEHRLPLGRLIYLGLLKVTNDFRSGMVLSQLLMATLSLVLVWAMVQARNGVHRLSDILFPLALLHLGHWENLMWGWQIQFVSSTFLGGLVLALLIYAPTPRLGGSLVVAVSLVLLPLSGANGIAVALGMVPWTVAVAFLQRRTPGSDVRVPIILLAAAALSVAVSITYFIGYVRPYWSPPLANPAQLYVATQAYFAMATGTWSRIADGKVALVVLSILIFGGMVAILAFARRWKSGDARAFGLVVFIGSNVALGLIIAATRGAYPYPLPARYALFSIMPLLAALAALEFYGPRRFALAIGPAFAFAFLLFYPWNAKSGFEWRDWYVGGMQKVEADIVARRPLSSIAQRNTEFLLHSCDGCLLRAITDLRDAKIKPFAGLPD
jgi:hypothetical protein